MNITARPTPFVKIPYNDPRFTMTDGIVQCNIAGIEIAAECPNRYRYIISEALHNGWIVPFAIIKQEMDYCI